MRPSRRKFFLALGLAVLAAVVVAAWLVASGRVDWLARWARPPLERALAEAGYPAQSLQLAHLSLGRAELPRLAVSGPGLAAVATDVRIELGWRRLLRGRVGAIQVGRLDLEIDPATWPAGGERWPAVPAASAEIAAGSVSILGGRLDFSARWQPEGDDRWTVAGRVKDGGSVLPLRASLDPAARGGRVEVTDARVALATVRAWWERLAPADLPWPAIDGDAIRISGWAELAESTFRAAGGRIETAGARLSRDSWGANLNQVAVDARWSASEGPAGSARGTSLEWTVGDARGVVTDWAVDLAPAQVRLEAREATVAAAGFEGRAALAATLQRDGAGALVGGSAVLHNLAAVAGEWRVGETALDATWEGGEIAVRLAPTAVSGPVTLALEEMSARLQQEGGTVGNFAGAGLCRLDLAALGARLLGRGVGVDPAEASVRVRFMGDAAAARRSVRLELQETSIRRTWITGDWRVAADSGWSASVTLDPRHVAAAAQVNLRAVETAGPGFRGGFDEVTLDLALPRAWREAVLVWPQLTLERVIREATWLANLRVRVDGGSVESGAGGATGIRVDLASRGADLSETRGGSGVLRADEAQVAGRSFRALRLETEFGLNGGEGRVAAESVVGGIPITVTQEMDWTAGLASRGTFAAGPVTWAEPVALTGLWPALDGIEVKGTAAVRGTAAWIRGAATGTAEASLEDVEVSIPDKEATITGLAGRVRVDSLFPPRASPGQSLSFAQATAKGVSIDGGQIRFGLPAADRLVVESAKVSAFGGTISAGEFALDPRRGTFSLRVSVDGARLERLLQFFPDVPALVEGSVRGEIPIMWDGREIDFGAGYLDLSPGELGRLRFLRDLRLLTSGRSERDQMYAFLRRIETGILDLRFDRLRIDLYPEAVPGRSLQLRLVGAADGTDVIAPVLLDLNVNAPLRQFIHWSQRPLDLGR